MFRRYWRLTPRRYHLSLPANSGNRRQLECAALDLPDSFTFVLEYFARHSFLAPYELLMELVSTNMLDTDGERF